MYESSEWKDSPWITLDPEGWAPLTEGRTPAQYRKKAILFHQEDAADGTLVFTSGQLPTENGVLRKGKLGKDITVEEGYEAARIAALNCLAVVKSLAGSLDRVERVVKVVGFVNCTPDFEAQPKVINGASELLGQVFGDAGLHARSAVGVSSLPLGACCEVELIVRLKP